MTALTVADYARFASAALPSYGLERATVELLSFSENATYLVRDGARRVVLRVHRPDYHSLAAVESELDWMDAVRRDTPVVTPEVIPAIDGRRVIEVRVGDRTCLCDLFTFVPGVVAEDATARISFSDLGEINARLHEHALGWVPPRGFTRFRWDLGTTLGPHGRWGDWRDAPRLTPGDAEAIEHAERRVVERLTTYGTGPDRFGLVHADLRLSNLIVDAGRITVIDFDDSGWGWFMTDLGAVVSWIEDSPEAATIVEDWLRGYRRVRPLAAADVAEIPTFVMLRRLMLTAWISTHPESEPARRLGPTYAAGTAALARRYLTDPSWFRVAAEPVGSPTAH